MDINKLKELASKGIPWAIRRLNAERNENAGNSPGIYISNMISVPTKLNISKGTKVIAFRCPGGLYESILQHKDATYRTASTIIKTALKEYFAWVDKLNNLKLEELSKQAKVQAGWEDINGGT